jgi:iduronate 2-sulfatase
MNASVLSVKQLDLWIKSLLALTIVWLTSFGPLAYAANRPNVLMILVDDLKPALGCYGDAIAKTPCLDALAARSMRFDLAYCNQAVCAPSRFTLMLGSHSTSTGLYGLGSELRKIIPDAVTMPQYFAMHGYRTESLGKVFHIGHGNHGDPESFSVPHFKEKVIEYVDSASTPDSKLTREEAMFQNVEAPPEGMNSLPRGAAFESPNVPDEAYADGRVAAETIRRLQAAKDRGEPFFMVAGFVRPHLPFSAPKKYWDLYDVNRFPLASNPQLPIGSPRVAHKRGGEIRNYFPVPDKQDPAEIGDSLARKLIHGYYASTSYVDAQIGKVIDELDRLGLSHNTIVVVWGDHGFHLGDLGIWTKHTNYEQANRIPMLISAPGITQPNSSTRQPAESVDIFPTLTELAGLPAPQGPQPIDGISLVPVLKAPGTRVRDHAYHAYPNAKLGRAIRTERYRLVEWRAFQDATKPVEYELYDYETDPLETRNLAAEKPEIVSALKDILSKYPQPVARN